MPNVRAKDFNNREELEDFISATYGKDIEVNKTREEKIEGERDDLKALRLTDQQTVWGLDVTITDTPTKKPEKKEKVKRGK